MKEAISTDTALLKELEAVAKYGRDNARNIYNELVKTGADFSIGEIFEIWRSNADATFIRSMVVNKKLQNETPEIYGMKVSKAKLNDLIEIENMDSIINTFKGVSFNLGRQTVHTAIDLCKISNGVLDLVPNYKEILFERCTFYVTTEEDKQKVEKLINTANNLNDLDDVLKQMGDWQNHVDIPLLRFFNGKFSLDMRDVYKIIKH